MQLTAFCRDDRKSSAVSCFWASFFIFYLLILSSVIDRTLHCLGWGLQQQRNQVLMAGWWWPWMLPVVAGRFRGSSLEAFSFSCCFDQETHTDGLWILNIAYGHEHVCVGGGSTHGVMGEHTSSPKARRKVRNTQRSILRRVIDGWNGGKHGRLLCALTHTVITSMWFVLKCHFCLDCSYFKPSVAFDFYLEMDVLGKYCCEDSTETRSRDQMVHFFWASVTNLEVFTLLFLRTTPNPQKKKRTQQNQMLARRPEKLYEKKNSVCWFIHQKSWAQTPLGDFWNENSWTKPN